MLAVAKAKHLDIADRDGAARGRDVAGWAAQDAVVGSGEGAFLDGDIASDVQGVDLHVRVRESGEPASEELGAGFLSTTSRPAKEARYCASPGCQARVACARTTTFSG